MIGQVYFEQSVQDPGLEFEPQEFGLEFKLEGPEPDSVLLDPVLDLQDLELHLHFDLIHLG